MKSILLAVLAMSLTGRMGSTTNEERRVERATGTFEVKLAPLETSHGPDEKLLGRLSLDKQFAGDLVGTSKGEMLTAGTTTSGSAAYVAIERVTGTLKGKRGSFMLHHRGVMTRGAPQLLIDAVPDSGTDELVGLSGTMKIIIEGKKHSYEMEYTLAS